MLEGIRPLAEPLMTYCQLGSYEQTAVNFFLMVFIQENVLECLQNQGFSVLKTLPKSYHIFSDGMSGYDQLNVYYLLTIFHVCDRF